MVIEVILDSSLHLIVSGCDFEVALRSKESTCLVFSNGGLAEFGEVEQLINALVCHDKKLINMHYESMNGIK